MYYEKLETEFQNSDLAIKYTPNLVSLLDNFIREELELGYEYLNPYRFAADSSLSVEESIQLFLTLTDDDKLFKVVPFIDCYRCSGVKIPLNLEELQYEELATCEHCTNNHHFSDFKKLIYVYFKLNDNITIPERKPAIRRFDPNSTYDIMERLSGNLKAETPSSSDQNNSRLSDEGDLIRIPTIDQIIENNKDTNGAAISHAATIMETSLMHLLMNTEAS